MADTSLGKAIAGSLLGTSLEWYDFFLYGSAAALVFNQVFFPSFEPLTGTLLAFLTFSVGFGARPIGGILAGHFGDRFGRKRVLVVTVSLMGVATVGIGLLPTYATVGVLAPALLIVVRLLQGLALGGEWAGGALMIAERAPARRRGYLASFVQVGVPVGTLLSTALLYVFATLQPRQDFVAWGWRVPFLASIVVVLVAVYIRRRVAETPAFSALEEGQRPARSPVLEVLRRQPLDILRVVGIRAGPDIAYYTFITFLLTYISGALGLPRSVGLLASLAGAVLQLFAYPAFAALSDRLGRRPVTVLGALAAAAWMFAFFGLVDTRNTALIVLAVLVGLLCHAAMYGVQAAWICELFETRYRYSGASLGYQLSGIVGGSLAPAIAVWLLKTFHSTMPIRLYVAIGCVVVAATALVTRETKGTDLERPGAVSAGRAAEGETIAR